MGVAFLCLLCACLPILTTWVNWPTTLRKKDGVHFFILNFECHNRYNKLLSCNSENGDIAWCNKNNLEWGSCAFLKKTTKTCFFVKKNKNTGFCKKTNKTGGLFFLEKKNVVFNPDIYAYLRAVWTMYHGTVFTLKNEHNVTWGNELWTPFRPQVNNDCCQNSSRSKPKGPVSSSTNKS